MNETGTVVLVHGAWHGGWCFDELIAELGARGITAVAPDLPGHGADERTQSDVTGDAASIIEVLATIKGPVVLVGHSYGGNVVSQVVAHEQTRSNIGHLVYICAIMNVEGKSFFDLPKQVHSGSLVGRLIKPAEGGLTELDVSDVEQFKATFAADCTDEQVARAASLVGLQNSDNMATPSVVTGPALVSSTYVVCTDDRTIPVAAQRAMVEAVKHAGVSLEVIELASSHSPFLSQTLAFADLLSDRLSALVGRSA